MKTKIKYPPNVKCRKVKPGSRDIAVVVVVVVVDVVDFRGVPSVDSSSSLPQNTHDDRVVLSTLKL